MHRGDTRLGLLLLTALPVFTAGCGGANSTGNGLFGGANSGTVGGATQTGAASPAVSTPSATAGSLQPNAAPPAPSTSAASGGEAAAALQTPETPNGPLAPLSGTYAGTWTAISKATAAGDAPAEESAPAPTGPVMLKIVFPAHASKTVLGDVTGTWTDPALGGAGRLSGTIDRIGLPHEPNAVHVVGSVRFPGGKTAPLAVQLAEDAVGHLSGATGANTLSLKKSR